MDSSIKVKASTILAAFVALVFVVASMASAGTIRASHTTTKSSYVTNDYGSSPLSSKRPIKKSNICYDLYSDMKYNNLAQYFPSNPDSNAKGMATCKLCTTGHMTCIANVYGGNTQLIASHIRLADDGDGVNGNGPPVISFCGTNGAGMINYPDSPKYLEECAPYNPKTGSALMPDMGCVLVDNYLNGTGTVSHPLADLVNDIGRNPGKYYLNYHSIASWSYWQMHGDGDGEPTGMCRGVMQLSPSQQGEFDLEEQ